MKRILLLTLACAVGAAIARGGFDYKSTEGTLISSRPLSRSEADIIDIAPTVLSYSGLPIPE